MNLTVLEEDEMKHLEEVHSHSLPSHAAFERKKSALDMGGAASGTELYPETDAEMDLGEGSTDVHDLDHDHDPGDDLSLAMSDVSMTMSVLSPPPVAPSGAQFSFENERSADHPSIENANVVLATTDDDDDDDDDDEDGEDGEDDDEDSLQLMCALRPHVLRVPPSHAWFVSCLHTLLLLLLNNQCSSSL